MNELEPCSHQMTDKNRCVFCGLFDYQIKAIEDMSKRITPVDSSRNPIIFMANPTKAGGNLRQQFLRGKSRSMIAQKFDWPESEESCKT